MEFIKEWLLHRKNGWILFDPVKKGVLFRSVAA